jgi:hypothetical protein
MSPPSTLPKPPSSGMRSEEASSGFRSQRTRDELMSPALPRRLSKRLDDELETRNTALRILLGDNHQDTRQNLVEQDQDASH